MTDDTRARLIAWLDALGALDVGAGTWLAGLFVVAAFLPVPRTFLLLAVGAVFGLPALPIVVPATTLGGFLAFVTARHLLAVPVQRRIDRSARLRAVADAVDAEGWRVLALLRFASPIPNTVMNYLFGLTRMRASVFVLVSFLATIPQMILYVHLGATGRELVLGDGTPLARAVMVVAAVSLTLAMGLVWRKARAALGALPAE